MPTKSPFPDIQIPNVDLWGLMFEEPRDFANSQGERFSLFYLLLIPWTQKVVIEKNTIPFLY